MREWVWERWKIQVPRSGQEVRIVRKDGIGGQVQAVYLATLEEGFLYSNPGRANIAFELWDQVERFDEPTR